MEDDNVHLINLLTYLTVNSQRHRQFLYCERAYVNFFLAIHTQANGQFR